MLGYEVAPRSSARSGCNTSREIVEALREVRCRLHVFLYQRDPLTKSYFHSRIIIIQRSARVRNSLILQLLIYSRVVAGGSRMQYFYIISCMLLVHRKPSSYVRQSQRVGPQENRTIAKLEELYNICNDGKVGGTGGMMLGLYVSDRVVHDYEGEAGPP